MTRDVLRRLLIAWGDIGGRAGVANVYPKRASAFIRVNPRPFSGQRAGRAGRAELKGAGYPRPAMTAPRGDFTGSYKPLAR
jgi:hypothetical protein